MTWRYRQFHNQPPGSPLDRWLTALWRTVRDGTAGSLDVHVCPQNDGIPGGDPEALRMLVAGQVEFYTVMGGLLGAVAPVAEIQNIPFAFRDHAQVHAAMDGALGDHLRDEVAARGLWMLPRACFENGFRHITTGTRPVRSADDLVGLRIRTPAGHIITEFFESLGARPIVVPFNRLYEALRDGAAEAQENPLVMVEVNRLYEVQRYLSLTGHIWSGFNLIANLAAWRVLPADVRAAAEHEAARHAALQRQETEAANQALVTGLARRGLQVNTTDTAGLRNSLGAFYARWKCALGTTAWALLEDTVGALS